MIHLTLASTARTSTADCAEALDSSFALTHSCSPCCKAFLDWRTRETRCGSVISHTHTVMSDLCLACASTLPPRTTSFITPCCQRSICPSCIQANPRLSRYDPCLSCLASVDVVSPRLKSANNIDGGVRDADNYTVGEDEDDSDLEDEPAPPPPLLTKPVSETGAPLKYHIQRSDTLRGIALRFSVSVRFSIPVHPLYSNVIIRNESYVSSISCHQAALPLLPISFTRAHP